MQRATYRGGNNSVPANLFDLLNVLQMPYVFERVCASLGHQFAVR